MINPGLKGGVSLYSMRVDPSFYELHPVGFLGRANPGRPRRGAILRVRFSDALVGYSDCHPWPELGDLILEDQLRLLKAGQLTPLTQQSVEFARADAEARAAGVSLWEGIQIPPSHALISDLKSLSPERLAVLAGAGVRAIKLKSGGSLEDAVFLHGLFDHLREHGLKVRLDFNAGLSVGQLDQFLGSLGDDLASIDFIEDPVPFDSSVWAGIQRRWGLRLALDRAYFDGELDPEAFSVLVFKPAVQSLAWALDFVRRFQVPVVVTSYLDHPLGQLGAAWMAGRLAREGIPVLDCGLLSHFAYQQRGVGSSDPVVPFFQALQINGAKLIPPHGLGLGWDHLLEGLYAELGF